MGACAVELFWLPVAAGTSRFQQASLRAWEAFEAFRCRRPRAVLYHAALKFRFADGRILTLEVTPAFLGESPPPLLTGPVGFRGADRARLFRYQLRCLPVDRLPDEEWAVESPVLLADDCATAGRLLDLAGSVPRHVWGRRAPGTREMWTSDSTLSWLLVRAGLDVAALGPPAGGRAPGWYAGMAIGRIGPGGVAMARG
jgi:hypothetical protein